ncbi:2-amino-4-hydroxy-6-hydroxymethyldihydropteridine diphosphokinase [Thermocrinis jamiesonii]|uniref:2-amino-4-hydroxy-6- hydroxymethyldihydropteridine diphosphokinase n=1 Tax=Thermocrinis jamiesonii TaxID=1302351 RepID=UPI000496F7CF|nr:2-amino-4-hydroxy-6-hydroxymethyldihydropteridine diphosphokinase [Thermocrinis jamiesonii]
MALCFLGLGSNVGDRLNYILKALDHIENYGKILKCSTVYESQPWGVKDQPSFLNSVVMVETNLRPVELLHRVKKSEILLGRKDRGRWGPREIDIDILLYEDHIIMLSFLKIPHPHLLERDFVLIPLLEIAPHLIHPLYKTPLSQYVNKIEISLKPFACLYGIDSKG